MEPLSWDEFIDKMEWEGGIDGMLAWGGPSCFPVEVQSLAKQAHEAITAIEKAVAEHGG